MTALIAGFFLSKPFRSPREPHEPSTAPVPSTSAERASLYAAIRDLEDDFETGKVSAEDHDAMRSELRGQAGELLRAERAAATPSEPVASADACSECGGRVTPDARFCSQCGAKLVAPPGAGERAG